MLSQAAWRALNALVDREQERAVERLGALLRMPTVAHPNQANPALAQCAQALVTELRTLGAADARIAGTEPHPLVLGSIGHDPGKPTMLIYGHFDVEDAGPLAEWETPPFDPTVRDGKVYARGSGDNKGQFLSHLLAVEAHHRCGIELPVNLKFVLDGAEEIGSPSLRRLHETAPEAMQADLVFGADGPTHESGRPKIVLGARGVVYVAIHVRTLRRSAHSQYAPVLPNAAWRAVDILGSLRDQDGRVTVAGFYDNVVRPAPDDLELLRQIPTIERELGREFEPEPPLAQRSPEAFNYELLMEPVLNIAGIASGDLVTYQTVVPGEAVIKMDIGIVPEQTSGEVIEKVRGHLRGLGVAPADVEVIFTAEPARTPPDHPLIRPMATALEQAWEVPPVIVNRFSGYCTHHYVWDRLGIKAISVSYAQPDESNHAPNERFALENFRKGIVATAAIMHAVGDAHPAAAG